MAVCVKLLGFYRAALNAFTNCDECCICIAIITMEYQITNDVQELNEPRHLDALRDCRLRRKNNCMVRYA